MMNLYFNTVKMLLERISSVMIDKIALISLIQYVEQCLRGSDTIESIGLNQSNAGERGVRLLQVRFISVLNLKLFATNQYFKIKDFANCQYFYYCPNVNCETNL